MWPLLYPDLTYIYKTVPDESFMANRWENNGIVTDFIFLGSKLTAEGDYSHGIKRCLLLGTKAMTNLDSMLKSMPGSSLGRIQGIPSG